MTESREYEQITYVIERGIATITLDRPDSGNGFTHKMALELVDAMTCADQDDDVRVIILTGRGRSFCVGADLSRGSFKSVAEEEASAPPVNAVPPSEWREPAGVVTMRMFSLNTPVIAAINGNAVGAGISLTLAADFRLVADDAKLGFVFVRRGITPEGASHWFLPRIVGTPQALDWMLTGRLFTPAEALSAGLVASVHPSGEVLVAAIDLARTIADNAAPVAVAVTRQMVYRMSSQTDPYEVHALESRLIRHLTRQPDAKEGVMSFMDRRQPEFAGRPGTDLPAFLPWLVR